MGTDNHDAHIRSFNFGNYSFHVNSWRNYRYQLGVLAHRKIYPICSVKTQATFLSNEQIARS